MKMPPARDTAKPDPNAPIFLSPTTDLLKRDFLNPPYTINNAAGPISSKTASVGELYCMLWSTHFLRHADQHHSCKWSNGI
jgi:hypothetical protein